MSGDAAFFGDGAGELARLVPAIQALERQGLPRHALIGGIAVIARLGQRHRATSDIDEVYLGDSIDAVQVLVDRGASRQPNGVILQDGTKVDLIAVGDYEREDLPEDTGQRAFILAHRWALDTSEPLTLVVGDAEGTAKAGVTTTVSTTAALVAMKISSAPARREPTLYKRATDIFDVYRLLTVHDLDGSVAAAVNHAPEDLAMLTSGLADRLLVREAERSVRWMLTAGGPEMEHVTAADLRAVGAPFVDLLA